MTTALLLNYKRPDNLNKIIKSLRSQTIVPKIFLWNNNIEDPTKYDVDLQINSSINLMCSPRWLMAGYCDSNYIFSLDDDLLPVDPKLIEKCVSYAEENSCGIGYEGVILGENGKYWQSRHIRSLPTKDISVDVIKGRFMFLKREWATSINWGNLEKRPNYRIEDDIILSASIPKKILPSFYHGAFQELPQPYALFREKDHRDSRQEAINKYFIKENLCEQII